MKLNEPYILFWITSFLIFLNGLFFSNSNDSLDINVHDTYFIIGYFHLFNLISFILFVLGFIYFMHKLSKTHLFKPLTKLHTLITIGGIGLYYLSFIVPETHSNKSFPLFDDSDYQNFYFTISIIFIVLISQLLLIINSLISLFKFTFIKVN